MRRTHGVCFSNHEDLVDTFKRVIGLSSSGQTRPVFAFRLIARDTVEEKVLELQATKRRLADAIVRADESLIRDLRREDLELLLS